MIRFSASRLQRFMFWLVAMVLVASSAVCLQGCGGGGGGGGTGEGTIVPAPQPVQPSPTTPSTSVPTPAVVGYVQTSPDGQVFPITMSPSPPAPTATPSAPASTPTVVAYQISSFNATVFGNGGATNTNVVAYGTVSGVHDLSSVRLQVFAQTNEDYIQPLIDGFVTINPDGTWICPCAPGNVYGLLTANDAAFTLLNNLGLSLLSNFPSDALPPVDGVSVLAEFSGVTTNAANAPGTLNPVPGSPFQVGASPGGAAMDPQGQFLFVSNGGSNSISAFTVNSVRGVPSEVAGSPFAAGGQTGNLLVNPTGTFLYSSNPLSYNLSVFSIAPGTGVLTPVPGSPFADNQGPGIMAMDPAGRFLYVANPTSNSLSVFSIDAGTGIISPVNGSPFTLPTTPEWIAIDPTGQFFYVANYYTGTVSGFTIAAGTGALTPMAGSPFAINGQGSAPTCVTVDPSGKYAYISCTDSSPVAGSVAAFSITPGSGVLVPVAGSPFAVGPQSGPVVVDDSGRFVYVDNYSFNNVSTFSIDTSTGALTSVGTLPTPTGLQPDWLCPDPTAGFLYVVNSGANDVSAFSITP